MSRWLGRLTALAATIFLLAGTGAAGLPAGATAKSARAPFGDYVDRLSFEVSSVAPAIVTANGATTLTITGRMTNTGPDPLVDLLYRFQRGSALDGPAAVRQELAEPSEPTERVQTEFTPMDSDLAAGESAPFVFTASIADRDGLAVSSPGVYPLLVNVNGAVELQDGPLAARIGELHLLLTVIGVPRARSAPAEPGSGDALPVNVLWPLVDTPHLGVGGVFLDENLLAAIGPGGRLSTLVNGLTDRAANRLPADTVTVVIDPQLLDELDRMTSAYRVVADPAQPQPPMSDIIQAEQTGGASSTATSPSTAPTATPTPSPTGTAGTRQSPTLVVTAPALPGDAGAAGGATQTAGQPTTAAGAPSATPPTSARPRSAAPTTTAPAGTAPPTTASPTTASPTAPGADPGAANIPGTIAGTGQAAAASFLQQLRNVADRYPVVTLPYGDPDVVAMVRAGLIGEVKAAVRHGTEVTQRVLGAATPGTVPVDTTTAYPINGAVDAATLAQLRADGLTTGLFASSSIRSEQTIPGAARVVADGDAARVSVPSVIAEADVLDGVGALISEGRTSGWAMRVNALTGVLTEQSAASSAAPSVFTPDRRWAPGASGLTVLTDLLATLGSNGVIEGVRLKQVAGGASVGAVPDYPTQARSQELPTSYLDRVRDNRNAVAALRQTLASTPQTVNPETVLAPLDAAVDAAGSTAFRLDPAVGEANLGTVESTTAGITNGVQILSAGNSYTLASSSSPLLLTVQNTLPYNVPVQVRISGGERVGLTVTEPGIQVVPAGRSQQVRIPAEVSRSGQFQVTAQLFAANGVAWGPPVELSVESTAYGALTVILIVVAGGVLVLMVVLRIVQRLRARRARIAAGGPTGQPTESAVDRNDPEQTATDTAPEGAARTAPPAGLRDILLADRPHDGADRGPTDPPVTADQMGTDRS